MGKFNFSHLCFFAISTAFIIASQQVSACNNNKIVVAGGNFPPYSYIDHRSKKCVGRLFDEIEPILREIGYKIKAVCAPPARLYHMMDLGHIGLTVNLKTTSQLNEHVTFSSQKISEISLSLYRATNDNKTKVIAGVRGYGYGGKRQLFIDDGFVFIDFPDTASAARFFLSGRVGYLMAYDEPFDFYVNRREFISKVAYQKSILSVEESFIAISNRSAAYERLVSELSDYPKP